MGRIQRFNIEDIQKGLCSLLREYGFGNFSMQLVASELNIPIGSLYHRYQSKDDMVADLWLSVIESFQNEFFKVLISNLEAIDAGKEAAIFVSRWMECEPEYAYLLAFVRKGDLNHKDWDLPYKKREKKIQITLRRNWKIWSESLSLGKISDEETFVFQSVIVDIPISVCKPYIGKKFPLFLQSFIADTYDLHLNKVIERKNGKKRFLRHQ